MAACAGSAVSPLEATRTAVPAATRTERGMWRRVSVMVVEPLECRFVEGKTAYPRDAR